MFADCVCIFGYRRVKTCTAQKLFLFLNVFGFHCDLAGHLLLVNYFCGVSQLWSAIKYWPIFFKKPKDYLWTVLQNQIRKDLARPSSPAVLP